MLVYYILLMISWMMINVLQPLLCTWYAKWAKEPPQVMKQSKMKRPSDMPTPRFELGW